MDGDYRQRLSIAVDGLPENTFSVARMSGREAISDLFRFEIEAVCDDAALAARAIVGRSGHLTIARLGEERRIHGMVERFELHGTTPQHQHVVRVVLVPRLAKLALSRQNQIHGTAKEVSVRDVLTDELTAATLSGRPAGAVSGRLGLDDFELHLAQTYPQRDYIVQFDETDFAFVSRLCEHYGIYYFFAHESGRDIVVFGDSRVTFPTVQGPAGIAYRPASGLVNAGAAAVYRFARHDSLVPAQVCLRDYNYRIPNLTLEVDETVDPDGHGVVVDYGSHFRTPREGRDLARVRAQELRCRKTVFAGAGDSVHFTAGAVFDLRDHDHRDFNAGYLLTWVEHEATQPVPGIAEFAGPDRQASYRNRFECLPKSVEFRPARTTPRPKMAGLSNAVVDGSGSGLRAELDAAGRYKVRQQFDQRGEPDGQSSRYMRKAEPYGGANTGMHFPLLKGTEVILACVNGDPDRPVIVGAMQNGQHSSVVNARNSSMNRMRTTSGALFEIDDGAASDDGGSGSAAGGGTTLAPQRALAGARPAAAGRRAGRGLLAQRAESDIQTSGDSSSSYARLQITSGSAAYWRLGSEPGDTTEDAMTPGMSDMTGGGDAGGAGVFEYAAGDRTSLIAGSSYFQVGGNRLDYIVGDRRDSASNHNVVGRSRYETVAAGIVIEAVSAAPTDDASPSVSADEGAIVLIASGDLTEDVGGSYNQNVAGDGISRTNGTEVSQTWGSTAEFMMGSAVSMTLGSDLSINMSSAVELTVGLKFELFVGAAFEFRIGPAFEFESSPAVELSATGRVETAVTKIDSAITSVTSGVASVASYTGKVTSEALTAASEGIKAKLSSLNVTF